MNTELCSHIDMVVNLNYNIFSFSSNYQFCLIITFMSDVFFVKQSKKSTSDFQLLATHCDNAFIKSFVMTIS